MGEARDVFNFLKDKRTGKRVLSRPKYRWEENIRM